VNALLRKAARGASDWVDLRWSAIIRDLRRAAPMARGRLLDVGCGDKPYESIFRPYVNAYVGVEHEATFAKTQASKRVGRPDALYDGIRLPFEDATFDTVLNVEVLEHTPDPQRLVDEMARVLRPDGLLIMSTPFSFRLHEEPHDYFRYTPHGLRELLTRAGMAPIEQWAQGALWSVVVHKLNSYLALRVGRLDAFGQALGKFGHEAVSGAGVRYWTIPWVAPTMVTLSAAARVLDRALPERVETLGYTTIARHVSATSV
jgi:SAM-dependent methyltransferase